jgi:hypothetical protein
MIVKNETNKRSTLNNSGEIDSQVRSKRLYQQGDRKYSITINRNC